MPPALIAGSLARWAPGPRDESTGRSGRNYDYRRRAVRFAGTEREGSIDARSRRIRRRPPDYPPPHGDFVP